MIYPPPQGEDSPRSRSFARFLKTSQALLDRATGAAVHTPVWELRSMSRYTHRGGGDDGGSSSRARRSSWAAELQSVITSASSGLKVNRQAWGPRGAVSSSADVDGTSTESGLRVNNAPAKKRALVDYYTNAASTTTAEPLGWKTSCLRRDTSEGGQRRINSHQREHPSPGSHPQPHRHDHHHHYHHLLHQQQTDSQTSLNLSANIVCPNADTQPPLTTARRTTDNEGNTTGNLGGTSSGGRREYVTGPRSMRQWQLLVLQRTKEAEHRTAASSSPLRQHRAASAPTRRTHVVGPTVASFPEEKGGGLDANAITTATSVPTCKERRAHNANKGRRRALKPKMLALL